MTTTANSTTERQHVLVFRPLPPDQLARLQAVHQVTVADPRADGGLAAFEAALPTANALIGSSYPVNAALLEKAPQLKVVSSVSVGVDNYELAALRTRGITLCHTPGVLTETTADTIFSLVLATSRRVVELANLVREGRWTANIGEPLFGLDVHGKTLGLLGFGRIGQAVARRAALGFGMPVLFNTRSAVDLTQTAPDLAGKATQVTLPELLAQSDFVVAVLPLNDQTRHLMNAQAFAQMKPDAIFINGARGDVVVEDALLHALDHGSLHSAGLDVFSIEPLPMDSPLRTHPRVTALPHVGSATFETRHAMAVMATSNLLNVLAGEPALAVFKG